MQAKLIKLTLVVVVLLCTLTAPAQRGLEHPPMNNISTQAASCSGVFCSSVNVSRVYINSDGITYIGTSGSESSLSCNATGGVYLALADTARNYEEIYALVLGAHLTNRPMSFRVVSGANGCDIAYVYSDQ